METREEIQNRVNKALASFNYSTMVVAGVEVKLKLDRYDYSTTHYNREAKLKLDEAVDKFQRGEIEKLDIKNAIIEFRDRSELGAFDFAIRVKEPTDCEFNQLCLLFGFPKESRSVPFFDTEEARSKHLIEKTARALTLALENPGSGSNQRLIKQFEQLLPRYEQIDPAYLELNSKSKNSQKPKLRPIKDVEINYDQENIKVIEEPTNTDSLDRMKELELLAPPVREQKARQPVSSAPKPQKVEDDLTIQPTSEFALFCEELIKNK